MCGIAGFIGKSDERVLRILLAGVKHRGPDDEGIFLKENVGLAHARLSIIDTSAGGHQPMLSRDGSLAVVFNGEIYNYRDLKSEVGNNYTFQGSSDTEVILALYEKYGMQVFEKLSGMFAIALYDFKKQRLILARDRMGEKPLYWTIQKGTLYFASELGSLISSGVVEKKIDRVALAQYLQFDYVPTPHTLVTGVFKLEPATSLAFEKGKVTKTCFWHPPAAIRDISFADAKHKLDEILGTTVVRELVSDVPLGVFLSGGIDSSTIAYYAQKAHSQPIDTFSIGFTDAGFDESPFARQVAAHLGTKHHEEILDPARALSLVSTLGDTLSEPIADASLLPTLLLSQFARKSVTVALGGDGGDELFAGYPTFLAEEVHGLYRYIPVSVRRLIAHGAELLPTSHAYLSWSYGAKRFVASESDSVVRRHLEWLGTFDEDARGRLQWQSDEDLFKGAEEHARSYGAEDEGNRLLYMYARTYLMDQVLVKVDRASMHHALETRAPFLDHAVVDFVFSLPYSFKYARGKGKILLKETMRGCLPNSIIDRKKKGFSIPLARWLAGPLQSLCRELLSEANLKQHHLFDVGEVHRLIDEHVAGRRDNRKELWNLMVFQLWYERWMR